jgi:hypothetical protein
MSCRNPSSGKYYNLFFEDVSSVSYDCVVEEGFAGAGYAINKETLP